MRLKQMLELFRSELGDQQEPYFWEDKDLVHYLNLAVQEACERALLIEDSHTSSVCHLQASVGVGSYLLHPSIIKAKRITVAGKRLEETSVEALDEESPGWESKQGVPKAFVFEGAQGNAAPRLRLVPTPSMPLDVRLTVYRGAIEPLRVGCDAAEPEVPISMRDSLKHWVYRCALLKNDADTQDSVRAADHEAIFSSVFGAKVDANTARKRLDRKPPVIRCCW